MLHRSLVGCALVLLAGCQDYNFNPVGKCVIQPGSSRIRIANLSTADILFVIDDSGSMEPAQANLARNFDTFISALAATQSDRLSKGLDALDFHVAITTSSIFENQAASTCVSVGGTLTCNVPAFTPYHGPVSYACSASGDACGDYFTVFHQRSGQNCTRGVSTDNTPYPAGDFVSLGANPKVTHFTKALNWAAASTDPEIAGLVAQFKDNVQVGSCGSGEEQHFEAGRLAVEKALGQNGLKQPAGVTPADWPHPGAKLVVVWVGNEDDCSNPGTDATSALVLQGNPGTDSCVQNQLTGKLTSVDDYAAYFTSLGRPFGAAFIYSAVRGPDGTLTAGNCDCQPPAQGDDCSSCPGGDCNQCVLPAGCGQAGQGTRFPRLAKAFRDKGVDTVEASVCDFSFGTVLRGVAELVKPPAGLSLPSTPAASEVAVLRIESADGKTSRQCRGPAAPGADLAQSDWWFVAGDPASNCAGGSTDPAAAPTSCIFINHLTGKCEPNPGETYIAQYLGRVPPEGCRDASACTLALGGKDSDWTCAKSGTAALGTCVCNPGT
jgi:hypothetical protein